MVLDQNFASPPALSTFALNSTPNRWYSPTTSLFYSTLFPSFWQLRPSVLPRNLLNCLLLLSSRTFVTATILLSHPRFDRFPFSASAPSSQSARVRVLICVCAPNRDGIGRKEAMPSETTRRRMIPFSC